MKIAKLLAGCLIAAVAILSCKKEDNNMANVLNDADNNFIQRAGISNHSEIETAKIALSKTTDSIVLSFAKQMLINHTNAQSDLKTMGSVVGFTIKDTTDAAHSATIAQLDTLTGRTFDSAYIHTQLADHKETINFYADELARGNQLNVRAYANTNLQNINLHYQRADSIAGAFY
ncbi:MAG: DUF4142 domain-containing protein [Segetibacter sp.]